MKEHIKPKFPAMDLCDWNSQNLLYLICESEQFNSSSIRHFKEMYFNHEVIDCNGNVFKIINYQMIRKCYLLPRLFGRMQMEFEFSKRQINLEELKLHYLDQISNLNFSDDSWKERVRKAISFEELFLSHML